MSLYANQLDKELALIKDPVLRDWTRNTLLSTPDYFFKGPASSTGKYHPACTIKEGGILVHVKRATYLVDRLCPGWGIDGRDRDRALAAIILHDIAKVGKGSGSYLDYNNHPINAIKYFAPIPTGTQTEDICTKLCEDIEIISGCIQHHMGLWTPDSIKKPLTKYSLLELLVYTADYLSATKDLDTPKDGE